MSVKKCPSFDEYISEFVFRKPVQTLSDSQDRAAESNPLGQRLMDLFDKAFKRITASRDDERFMDEVFCYPTSACDYAVDRIEGLHQKLPESTEGTENQSAGQENPRDAVEIFNRFRDDYLHGMVEDLISMCHQTRPTNFFQGIERLLLWVGEKGCGKTTFVNYLFLKHRQWFDDNKIIWVRYSVFFTDPPRDVKELEHKFCNKVIRILGKCYASKLGFESTESKLSIWRDRLKIVNGKANPEAVAKRLQELERSDPAEHLSRLIKFINKKGWSFIFILDNIDQYENPKLAKETIKFGVKLGNRFGRNLVIMVARIDTINEHLRSFRDVYQNIRELIFYIPLPNFQEVFEKRLKFLETHLTDPTTLRTFTVGNKAVSLSEGFVARNLTKYFLTTTQYSPDKYLIAELANNNIRDMFKMLKSILRTHLIDVTDIPLQEICNQYDIHREKLNEVEYDATLRDHMIIWALLLKNYLFYRDKPERSWLINLYGVESEEDSYWNKRLIIDFFIYVKESNTFNLKSVSYRNLRRAFVKEMGFNEDELKRNLEILCERIDYSPLLWIEKHPRDVEYRLTPKGELYGKYLADLYVYIEMILEDTLLPVHSSGENSVLIELMQYEPMLERDLAKRRRLTHDYFRLKRKQVADFSYFLECQDRNERARYNDFYSRSFAFHPVYFPDFRKSMTRQSTLISNALKID